VESISPETLRRATDRVLGLYLLISAGLLVASRAALPSWPSWKVLFVAHLVGAGIVLSLRSLPPRLPAVMGFLRDWYPAIAFPFLYKEVEPLARAAGNWSLTLPLQRLEASLFLGQPSRYLSERLPSVLLSESLHFCYLSYILLVPVIGGIWYFRSHPKGRAAFHELLFLVSVTYAVSYLFYSLFPVDSPFYLSAPPGPPFEGHFFYDLVHFLSSRGGARGGAFPSSHVSVSTVVLLVAWRRQRSWLAWLLPIYAGLVFATVFGRFHYAVDVLAGWTLALAIVATYRRWYGAVEDEHGAADRRDALGSTVEPSEL
jgi:membrane-associated phospholipid phosphatase